MNDKDTNKRAVVAAIWAHPEKVFGCSFKQSGRMLENADRGGVFGSASRGAVRLSINNEGSNIRVFCNSGSGFAGISDNRGREGVDVFTFLQDHVLNTTTFGATLAALADVYGLELNYTQEQAQALTRELLARDIAASLVEALRLNPEGTTANYIRGRGLEPDTHFGELSAQSIKAAKDSLTRRGIKWTVDDFKALKLTEEQAQKGFTCVIPFYHNGNCIGFKYRNTNPNCKHNERFDASIGMKRGVGYCDRLETGQTAFVVEGEMDAVCLMQSGIRNVIAMGGATSSEDLAHLLRGRNVAEIVYIPDNDTDAQGQRETERVTKAIKAFQALRSDGQPVVKSLHVCPLSTVEGVTIKDVNDYFKLYGAEALKSEIQFNTLAWWAWEIETLETTVKNTTGDINQYWFREQFNDIYQRCAVGYERQAVRDHIQGNKLFELFGVTPQALTDIDEWTKGNTYTERVKAAADELNKAVAEGSTEKVAQVVARLNEAQAVNSREEWDRQLNETFEDELKAIREQPDALKTKWDLGKVDKKGTYHKTSNIDFYPADVAVVCAVSSHGKTTFLIQSVLDMVAKYTDKTFIYVSCEENKRQLVERVLNTYLDIPTTETGLEANGTPCFIKDTRKQSIKAAIRGTVPPEEYKPYMGQSDKFDGVKKRIRRGLNAYETQVRPRLKLIHTDATVEGICGNVRHYIEQLENEGIEVGGVFVDYMQLLTTDSKNYSRHDELKDICKALKGCAEKTEIPFVVAAQLNRTGIAEGIDSITMANIGEGADIERIAHDIYFIWQVDKTKVDLYFKLDEKGNRAWNPKAAGDRSNRIFTYNELQPNERELKDKYLYVEHIKARDGKTGGWGLLDWNGESGKIGENDKQAMKQ